MGNAQFKKLKKTSLLGPEGSVGILMEPHMSEELGWHIHTAGGDVQPVENIERVRCDRATGRNEEPGLHMQHNSTTHAHVLRDRWRWTDGNA